MITYLPDFVSLNRLDDVPPGRYFVVESLYALKGSVPTALLRELVTVNNNTVAADLQFSGADGTVLFRDFALCPDGTWRDSYGSRSEHLANLMPSEFMRYQLIDRKALQVEHDGQANLTPVVEKGGNHGS